MLRFPRTVQSRLLTMVTLMTVAALTGCSAASEFSRNTSAPSAAQSKTSPSSGPGSEGGARDSSAGSAPGMAAAPPAAVAPELPRGGNALERPPAKPGATSDPSQPQPPAPAANAFDRMIIYTTAISLTVKDVPAAVDEVSGLTARSGGYLAGSSVRQEGERTIATITLRVPSQGYADVMSALRRMGVKVESEKGEAKDVTEEFADLDAQVRNLEVTEAQLRELMKKAATIDEILRVQNQISSVRGQIERFKGRQQFLQRNAELATITVTLLPEMPGKSTDTPKGWDPLRIAAEAWQESLKALQAVLTVGIRVLVFSWWLLPPLAWLAYWLLSRRSHRPAANPAP